MSNRVIAQADLSHIASRLRELGDYIDTTNGNVIAVGREVEALRDDLEELTQDFHAFVDAQKLSSRAQLAETRLVKLRQELEQKYGHYAVIRRTTKGILQANDLAIVRQETIRAASEELMLRAPEYWLAPALVALSAWISDNEEIAPRALKEALRRDEEKTALFFALVCRRAERSASALRWAQHYLVRQDETALDRKSILIVDAYASGLLGRDTEGLLTRQIDAWIERLSEKAGFVEEQERRWKKALDVMQPEKPEEDNYPYLAKYSPLIVHMQRVLGGAYLHEKFYNHLQQVFEQQPPLRTLVQELDRILTSLVTDFDAAEQPLRAAAALEQLVVDAGGDEERAKREMKLKEKAFEERRDFMQLLTDAAMNPAESHASVMTQKMALAVSRDWILSAYRDHIAENRAAVPNIIPFKIGGFEGETADGENEAELLKRFQAWNDYERDLALANLRLTNGQKFAQWGGILTAVLGFYLGGAVGLVIGIAIGVYMYYSYRTAVHALEEQRAALMEDYAKQGESGTAILRGILAEVVDYRDEFAQRDAESKNVIDFLSDLNPAEFRVSMGDRRRIQIQEGSHV